MKRSLPNTTVCVALLVTDETPVTTEHLLALRAYVDVWLLHDLSSNDSAANTVKCALSGINGHCETYPKTDIGVAKNRLLANASLLAQTVLILNANEECQSILKRIYLPDNADIGLIDVVSSDHVLRVPRLFRSTTLPSYRLAEREIAEFDRERAVLLSDVLLKCHPRIDTCKVGLDSVNVVDCDDVIHCPIAWSLTQGQCAFSDGDLGLALQHFQTILNTQEAEKQRPNEFWRACYMAAKIELSLNRVEKAITLFTLCFDSFPERAEPLIQLAEIHYQRGEQQAAHNLCEFALGMSIPRDADYFEPNAYDDAPKALLKKMSDTPREQPNDTPTQMPIEGCNTSHSSDNLATSLKLTIGMATYDDYDGVYFSIMSLVLYHSDCLENVEILVIDNNPSSNHGKAVKKLCERVKQARYVAASEYTGTAVRERIFSEARADFVLGIDCHVFLHQGAVDKLLKYISDNPNSKDLFHGPIFYDDLETYSTHMEPVWNAGFYGTWGIDKRGANINGAPFEIPLQGMGLFACYKRQWLGFNPRFRGFGGEEGYIHEKFRQNGGRVLCLPFLRWTHRFDRPNGAQYTNQWEDRIRNYLVGWHELGLDTEPVLEHFKETVGFELTASINASFLFELNSALWGYDTVYFVCRSPQQSEEIATDLKSQALDKVAQPIDQISELPSLLRTAKARELREVVILDFHHSMPQQAQQLLSQVLSNKNTDIAVHTLSQHNGGKILARAHLINAQAFEQAADCFAKYGELSESVLSGESCKCQFTYGKI